jgi:hypothetical protein
VFNPNGIRTGELLVIVEYCRFGNLQTYLINHRSSFINLVDEFGNIRAENEMEYVDIVATRYMWFLRDDCTNLKFLFESSSRNGKSFSNLKFIGNQFESCVSETLTADGNFTDDCQVFGYKLSGKKKQKQKLIIIGDRLNKM